MNRKLRMGMVGGGKGAFIGAVHRIAANMDGMIELVCGAFSSRAEVSHESGKSLFLPADRIYDTYEEMFERESKLPADQRMDFVAIVTPNHAHFEPAIMALDNGFHVVIDKPITFNLDQARKLDARINETGLLLLLTHTYAGYPMVKQAREMVKSGVFGKIRKVYVEYPQGWLSRFSEAQGNPQAEWRTDPQRSGISGCMGDIGTHAAHLAEHISNLKIEEVCADLKTFVDGRKLDDDGNVLLRFNNGATGVLFASQVAAGEENAIKIRVYGEKGGLEWQQQEPNTLLVKWLEKPTEVYRTGASYLSSFATHNTRTPGGHPEGYLEAFANLYRNFALTLSARLEGRAVAPEENDFPSMAEGIRGMAFIETVVRSSQSSEKWTKFTL